MSEEQRGNELRRRDPLRGLFPLLRYADASDLPLETVLLTVLGHCVAFMSNDQRVIEIACERFARWDEHAAHDAESRLTVLVTVSRLMQSTGKARAVADLVGPDAIPVNINAPDAFALVYAAVRVGCAVVHASLLAQHQLFAEEVLDATILATVSQFDRHPLHAATIARGEHAVLLYGASGAGKSTLAWMAHSAGLTVLGDDRAWIQLQPELHLWMERARVRLHPEAMTHFPEADRARVELDAARRDKFVAALAGGTEAHEPITRVTPCLLARSSTSATLERIGRDDVLVALSHDVPPGFDRFPARHAEVAARIAADGGWLLSLSVDPWEALPFLRTMLRD